VIAYLYYDTIGSIMQEKVPNTVKRHSQLNMRLKYNVKSYMRLKCMYRIHKRRKTAQLQT